MLFHCPVKTVNCIVVIVGSYLNLEAKNVVSLSMFVKLNSSVRIFPNAQEKSAIWTLDKKYCIILVKGQSSSRKASIDCYLEFKVTFFEVLTPKCFRTYALHMQ